MLNVFGDLDFACYLIPPQELASRFFLFWYSCSHDGGETGLEVFLLFDLFRVFLIERNENYVLKRKKIRDFSDMMIERL